MKLNDTINSWTLIEIKEEKYITLKLAYLNVNAVQKKYIEYLLLNHGDTKQCYLCTGRNPNRVAEKHGDSLKSSEYYTLYSCWKQMYKRCNNPNATHYKNYGGRGIKVDSCWNSYLVFKDWSLKIIGNMD